MAIVPDFLANIIAQNARELQEWLSEQLYAQVVQRGQRHLLVRLQACLDLEPLEAGCRGYHHASGAGAKPTHTVPRLVRALVVKYLYNWSLREAEERIQHDLVVKWFVGYGVFEAVMDHSQLERFEQWVQRHQQRLYFDTVLNQIDAEYPEERGTVQIGDTFALHANAALEGLVELLRHTSRCVLRELEQGAPAVYQQVLAGWDPTLLMGANDEALVFWLSEAEKEQRRENAVRGAWQLRQRVAPLVEALPEPLRTRVRVRVEDLDKIFHDELRLSLDPDGQVERVEWLDAQHKGKYRLCSATDPDATVRWHGTDQAVGYNASLAVTPQAIIRATHAATGAEPDQSGIPHLLAQQQDHQGQYPPKLIYDRGGGSGRTRAVVNQVSGGQTQLVAHILPPSTHGRFLPERFHRDAEGGLVCPQGKVSPHGSRAGDGDGTVFLFPPKLCQDCPVWRDCRGAKSKPTSNRSVFISDYQEEIRLAQQYNQTPQFKAEMSLRPLVERVIFMLTHYDGARFARRRGIAWADFQLSMCATARNLRTWLNLRDRAPRKSATRAAAVA